MKVTLVTPKVELLWITPDAARHIERAGRVCYKSEDKITAESAAAFVKKVKSMGHLAVIEHASASFLITTDRGITHEAVRHRLASYCLSGDTVVPAFQKIPGRPSKKWTLRQLHDWSQDPKRKGRIKLIRLRSVDAKGCIVQGRVKSVSYSGVQPTLLITTESGRRLRATASHRVLTPAGWKICGNLKVGGYLMANGRLAVADKEWIYNRYVTDALSRPEVAALAGVSDATMGKWIRHHGIKKSLSLRKNRKPGHGVPGMHSAAERARISVRMSGAGNHRWRGDAVGPGGGRIRGRKSCQGSQCYSCGCTDTDMLEVHHVDGDPINNSEENLRLLCYKCHKAWHRGQAVQVVYRDKIVSITAAGSTDTYDIAMEGVNHNFVANGVVVHNCQESTRYVNYDKRFGLQVIPPEGLTGAQFLVWSDAMAAASKAYEQLIELGCTPQQARDVLPTCTKADLVFTANFREWLHVIELRTASAAHPKIRTVINEVRRILIESCPEVFA